MILAAAPANDGKGSCQRCCISSSVFNNWLSAHCLLWKICYKNVIAADLTRNSKPVGVVSLERRSCDTNNRTDQGKCTHQWGKKLTKTNKQGSYSTRAISTKIVSFGCNTSAPFCLSSSLVPSCFVVYQSSSTRRRRFFVESDRVFIVSLCFVALVSTFS